MRSWTPIDPAVRASCTTHSRQRRASRRPRRRCRSWRGRQSCSSVEARLAQQFRGPDLLLDLLKNAVDVGLGADNDTSNLSNCQHTSRASVSRRQRLRTGHLRLHRWTWPQSPQKGFRRSERPPSARGRREWKQDGAGRQSRRNGRYGGQTGGGRSWWFVLDVSLGGERRVKKSRWLILRPSVTLCPLRWLAELA